MPITDTAPPDPAADEYASIDDQLACARQLMASRPPDVIIGGDYLHRWHVWPRNPDMNVYLHLFLRSDDDRALHDHPWDNTSLILSGRYIEHTPHGQFLQQAGDRIERQATDLHRIELIGGQPVISLFMTGRKVRDWGFACPQGWVPWQQFCAPGDSTQVGRGCGEGEAAAVNVPREASNCLPPRPLALMPFAEAVLDATARHERAHRSPMSVDRYVSVVRESRRCIEAAFANVGISPDWLPLLAKAIA